MPDLRKRKFKRVGKVTAPVQPVSIQADYYRYLRTPIDFAHLAIKRRLVPLLPALVERAAGTRGDALHLDAQAPGRRVSRLLNSIAETTASRFSQNRLEKVAEQIARATSAHQKNQLFRQVKKSLGVDLGNIVDKGLRHRVEHFTAENVALAKSIPADYLKQTEQVLLEGLRDGTRHETLAEQIEERFQVAASRAKLIARDQVLKFNGELNGARQQSMGIERYIWRTVHDNRVREAHAERDGEIYRWDDPPGDPDDPGTGGHPGEAVNCRCFAEPLFEDLLNEEE